MVKETKIEIAGKEYLIKRTYRSLILFEDESKKPISDINESVRDILTLFYCIVKSNNVIDFSFDQFINLIDETPTAIKEFNKYLRETMANENDTAIKKNSENL